MSKRTANDLALERLEHVRSGTVPYIQVPEAEVPSRIRWDTPRREQGQIVETSYAQLGARGEAGYGDLWMRVTDHSTRAVTYYKRGE